MATVKDALEILGYGSAEKMESEIFGISRTPKKKAPAGRKDSELKVAYNRRKTDILRLKTDL